MIRNEPAAMAAAARSERAAPVTPGSRAPGLVRLSAFRCAGAVAEGYAPSSEASHSSSEPSLMPSKRNVER